MAYIESSNIKVFPAVARAANYDDSASLTTEHNISNIIRSLYNKKEEGIHSEGSFILPESINTDGTLQTPLKIVVAGYYFEITDISKILNSSYVIIKLRKPSATKNNYQELTSFAETKDSETQGNTTVLLDEGEEFKGLIIDTNLDLEVTYKDSATYEYKYLQLTDVNGKAPKKSKLHWNREQLDVEEDNFIKTVNQDATTLTASVDTSSGNKKTLVFNLNYNPITSSSGSALTPVDVPGDNSKHSKRSR